MRTKTGKNIKCKVCSKEFYVPACYLSSRKYCSWACVFEDQKKNRIGKKNPAYRNGLYTTKNFKGKKGVVSTKHLRACANYRKEFIERCGRLFCEICRVNVNGTLRFEVHDIYYASLYPRHPELHNPKNLILLCIKCHNDLQSGKMRSDIFLNLEEERGLKELFKNNGK